MYEVRETAVRVILDMYTRHQALVLEYLPPDDSGMRRNLLYKTIFEGFARIDGRPSHAEIRVRGEPGTWVSTEHIRALCPGEPRRRLSDPRFRSCPAPSRPSQQ